MPKNHIDEKGYEHQQTSSRLLISLSETNLGLPQMMVDLLVVCNKTKFRFFLPYPCSEKRGRVCQATGVHRAQ
jgi:hypothetical protein